MKSLASLALAGLMATMAHTATASDRYGQRPPVVLSPDLSAPWVMQLGGRAAPQGGVVYRQQTQKAQRSQAAYQVRQGGLFNSQRQRSGTVGYAAPKPQPKAQTKKRNLVLAAKLNGSNLSFRSPGPKPSRNNDAVKVL